MAQVILNVGTVFPEGTTISAYRRVEVPAGGALPPPAEALDTQTVVDRQVTFTVADEPDHYLAVGQVGSTWRSIAFSVDPPPTTLPRKIKTGDIEDHAVTADKIDPGVFFEGGDEVDPVALAALAAHEADTSNVHGIPDTSQLIKEGDPRLTDARPPTSHTHPPSEIEQGGATIGQALTWDGDEWAPADVQGGGGGITEEEDPVALAALAAHEADTVSVHGIADTADLIVEGDPRLTDSRDPNPHNHDDRYYTEAEVDAALAAKQDASSAATDAELAAHASDTTNVHGIADTAALATKAELPVVEPVSASLSRNLQLSDAGKVIETTGGTNLTFTIPPDSSVNFPVGTVIGFFQLFGNSVTIAPGSGVFLRSYDAATDTGVSGARTLAGEFAEATIRKRAADSWVISGALADA